MTKILDLLEQLESVNAQIVEFEGEGRAEAITRGILAMNEYGLTPDDLGYGRKRNGEWTSPKYINRSTGQTWHGLGRRPLWLTDENLDDHLIWADPA